MKNKRNTIPFGVGTIGRDMVYSLISMFLIYYLTEVLNLSNAALGAVTIIMVIARVFDALNDPVMGVVVDNTKSKWGKFKPWIAIGAFASGILTVLLFTDFKLGDTAFIVFFAVTYLLWGIAWTINDISYWSMLPALSTDQKQREKIGAFARICANLGLALVVVGVLPGTSMLGDTFESPQLGFFAFAIIVVVIMWIGQLITLFGVKEKKKTFKQEESTNLKGMVKAIFKNDQLLYVAISMALFMIGYVTTTSFGPYFFKYAYGDENMYSIFGGILILTQIVALALFPLFSKRYNRKQLYGFGTILVILGYIVFFFAPMNMLYIGIAGVLLFVGQAFIQLLMLMFLADSVEYGQWKLGKRNESVTFALQPFINKMGGAIGTGIVGLTLIISGINEATAVSDVTADGLLIMKVAMLLVPLIFILAGYLVYRAKFKIDEEMYEKILGELQERGDIKLDGKE